MRSLTMSETPMATQTCPTSTNVLLPPPASTSSIERSVVPTYVLSVWGDVTTGNATGPCKPAWAASQ